MNRRECLAALAAAAVSPLRVGAVLHLYEIETDGSHWYAAESPEEALALMTRDWGEELDSPTVEQVPDGKEVEVCHPDERGQPVERRKAIDWCDGKGFVATTEY